MTAPHRFSILDVQERIQSRVRHCALCGGADWKLDPDLYVLHLSSPWAPRQGSNRECAVLTCFECGNTHLVNVELLFADKASVAGGKKTGAVSLGTRRELHEDSYPGLPRDED